MINRLQLELCMLKKVFFWSVISLAVGLGGCSGDDDEQPGGGEASPYWTLGNGNANMPSSGTIIAQYSDAPAGSEIGKLVDNDANTKYVTYHDKFDINWNGNSNAVVLTYSLTSADDQPEMDPKSWTLSGSLDNKTWKTIDKQTNRVFTDRKETKTFELDNNVSYRYYRLSITENNGGSATQIAEWVLSAATFDGNIDDLMAFSTGNTYTSETPMGTIHLGDLTASAADLEWLKDPAKEPDTFGGLSWATFQVGSLYPFGDPKPADVNQHSIGDCCACAVMASIAYLFPKYIKKMVKENGNNTFTVTLFDPKGKAVEIGVSNYFVKDDSGNIGAVSGKNNKVTWATVIEKAVIKWKQVYGGTSDINGIASEYVSAILTGSGNSFAFSPNKLSANELKRAAMVSLQQRKIVIGGFTTSDLPIGNFKTVSAHAYSFYPAPDDNSLFMMRNPWGFVPMVAGGYSDGKEDGLLEIKNDKVIPPVIDLRIIDAGAAAGYAIKGNLEPYTPPSYALSPMRIARNVLNVGR